MWVEPIFRATVGTAMIQRDSEHPKNLTTSFYRGLDYSIEFSMIIIFQYELNI